MLHSDGMSLPLVSMADLTCWGKSHHQHTLKVVVVLDVWVDDFDVLEGIARSFFLQSE